MKQLSFICLMLGALIFTSCNAVSVASDYDRNANFTSYKTYSYHQKGIDKLSINDLDKRRIVEALDKEMAIKGFSKVNSGADLVINVLASSSQEISIDNDYFAPYGYGYWGGRSPYVSEYTAGKIIVDVIDDKRNILVWQGVGSGLNLSKIESKSEKIPQAINEILSKFPPQVK